MSGYKFRREDNGEIVEVDFQKMMTQDVAGFIDFDGVSARRCFHLEEQSEKTRVRETVATPGPYVSDTLGFTQDQYADFEADRQRHGFSGVEFVRDPDVPQFYQVKVRSRREYERYVKHRGYVNATSIGGVRFSPGELERVAEKVKQRLQERRNEQG